MMANRCTAQLQRAGFAVLMGYCIAANSVAASHPCMQLSGLNRAAVCRFLVEIEIILPAQMTVQESHDIALMLQHKVEALPDVERGWVVMHKPLRVMLVGAALHTKPRAEGCS